MEADLSKRIARLPTRQRELLREVILYPAACSSPVTLDGRSRVVLARLAAAGYLELRERVWRDANGLHLRIPYYVAPEAVREIIVKGEADALEP